MSMHPPWIIYYFVVSLGVATLFSFLFSIFKPSPSSKKYLAISFAFLLLMASTLVFPPDNSGSNADGMSLLVFLLALPPVAALFMSFSGISALAAGCSEKVGVLWSYLSALGCIGLTLGLSLALFRPTSNEGGIIFFFNSYIGGGIAAIIAFRFASSAWKKRKAPA